ncbi:phosphate/phosphite/phosphonate ABC transporter substrate-binding protein [Candidatus Igneacidithiobacillus taiwanensis]|uniref:phosphate/phosphite/phosphonate ABC transporter substrate-binding protein n=1 Tax=Candidatus Igneacidithiobacillus taiwanensis TaxID=1945924 RepID=UPI00289CCAB4|nr:phosphate/phosphite/phosphonate ABC transporter substrate-binding protein [Candidatus Igneacidithiobacillus taiwanensis]
MPHLFSADPNYTGKNLPAWFLFNNYLQKKLDLPIRFTPFLDIETCRSSVFERRIDIIYANPFDWVRYVQKLGYIPLVKPRDHFDEVFLCTQSERANPLEGEQDDPIRIASASQETLVHMVGLFLLDKLAIDRARLQFVYTGSYQTVIKALLRKEVDVGFVFNEVYASTTPIIRQSLRILAESDDGFAFHALCISPALLARRDDFIAVLRDMHQDKQGKSILAEIGFTGFEPVTLEETECLSALADEYITGHEALDIGKTSTLDVDDSKFLIARKDED